MCNEARRQVALGDIRTDWGQTRIPLVFPEGLPNLAATDSVRITDQTPIIRAAPDGAELAVRRWSWPGPSGKPVYNYRSERRDLRHGRCLIPVDGFYEFTDPADPAKKRKDKWLFTWPPHRWFCIAGLWRRDDAVGEAFTMLTTEPGPDIAPYHGRQVVLLGPEQWGSWLDDTIPSQRLIAPLPAGTLAVEQVG
ncbi:SOS response-associated peptidase family protein [Sphingomonas jatrophae]|uniref:Abasic site processing protein n=1 Tax=Sphingomonas jatrophae TaxID=1166337 RepID=A0A1I6LBF1_9SPHN|nr:SOS response-associated peptidase [Sphingomonas jatrophae]SFS00578.1 Putative SOS response-associated peptidase YedK [Sphingomonas jatrophae]